MSPQERAHTDVGVVKLDALASSSFRVLDPPEHQAAPLVDAPQIQPVLASALYSKVNTMRVRSPCTGPPSHAPAQAQRPYGNVSPSPNVRMPPSASRGNCQSSCRNASVDLQRLVGAIASQPRPRDGHRSRNRTRCISNAGEARVYTSCGVPSNASEVLPPHPSSANFVLLLK
jgi:hypothetical protein